MRFLALLSILVSLLLTACSDPEERAAGYLAEARTFYEAGDYVFAKVEARNALQIDPKNSEARYLLALINEQDKDFGEAIGNLMIAVESDPGYLDARLMLGRFYVMGQQVDEAAEQAEAVMALDPDNAAVRLLNAQSLYLQGEPDTALAEVGRALQLNPQYREAVTFAAALHTAAGRTDEALAVIDRGIEVASAADIKALRMSKIEIYRRLGDGERGRG